MVVVALTAAVMDLPNRIETISFVKVRVVALKKREEF